MPSSLYVALSGQVSMERRLQTIANNVANLSTAGFRSEEVKFESLMSKAGVGEVDFVTRGDTFISRRPGPVSFTGNQLDVAIQGEAWFAFEAPEGVVYSKDGRLQMTELGDILTVDGYPVLDAGNAPLRLDPLAGPPQIGADGGITQDGIEVGALGLFSIPESSRLTRHGGSGVIPSEAAVAVDDMTRIQVRQGFVEGSNVNPMAEITKLITVQRAFENAAAAISESESTLDKAIQSLGPST